MKAFERIQPKSWDEAVAALDAARRANVPAEPKGAGTDILDRLKERTAAPDRVVDLRRLPDASGIALESGAIRIGSLVTLARAAREIPMLPALAAACGDSATPQIRNVATLGGALCQRPRCWYFRSFDFTCLKKGGGTCFAQEGDNRYHAIFGNRTCAAVQPSSAATPLVAYGASVRTIPLESFFTTPEEHVTAENALAPSEVVTHVLVPVPERTHSAWRAIKQKRSFDWPLVDCAVVYRDEGGVAKNVRIVLGSVAHQPLRARAAEALVENGRIDAKLAARAAEAAIHGATPLAKNGYKLALVRAAVRRALLGAAGLPDGTEEV